MEEKKVINENREDVELLQKTLMEYESITGEEIDYLMEHRHMKDEEKKAEEEAKPEQPAEQPVEQVETPAEENK